MTATTSIPQLPVGLQLDGTEEFPAVQNGVDKRFTIDQVFGLFVGFPTFRYATLTGTPVPGNVPVLTATGVTDSGVQLLTAMVANTVWGNNSTLTSPPQQLATILLANGAVSAPAYGFVSSPGTGIYATGTLNLNLGVAGSLLLRLRGPSPAVATAVQIANSGRWIIGAFNPTAGATATVVGMTMSSGSTGPVTLECEGSNPIMLAVLPYVTAVVNTANNYLRVRTGPTGDGPSLTPVAQGSGDTNIPIVLNTVGNALLKFGNANNFAANGSVTATLGGVGPAGSHTTVQEWLQITNASGVTRYLPLF